MDVKCHGFAFGGKKRRDLEGEIEFLGKRWFCLSKITKETIIRTDS